MNKLLLSGFFSCCVLTVQTQTVDVRVVTSKKEAAAILKKAQEETRANRAYFTEDEKCRNLIKSREWVKAELSCRTAITLVEKLPKQHVLERSSARLALAVALLWQRKIGEAIPLINASIDIGKSVIDDSDAEMGERYFLLGQAYHLLGTVDDAAKYYTRAESTYRTAFKEMGDSDIRGFYPKPIVNILEAHLALLQNAGRTEAAATIEKRLAATRIEFAEFLKV
jgi:tetratricopeptide (TPR) repeat protein